MLIQDPKQKTNTIEEYLQRIARKKNCGSKKLKEKKKIYSKKIKANTLQRHLIKESPYICKNNISSLFLPTSTSQRRHQRILYIEHHIGGIFDSYLNSKIKIN